MGSRGRSIRLRIYFLVTIPLVTMLAMFGYTAWQSISNYRNVTRAPKLVLSTAEASTAYFLNLQAERRAAVVYLSHPTQANFAEFQRESTASKNATPAFEAAMASGTVRSVANAEELEAIDHMVSDLSGAQIQQLRLGVMARKVTPFLAWEGYTKTITDQVTMFNSEAGSFTNAESTRTGFGLIEVVMAREDVHEMDALLSGGLASGSMTLEERAAFSQAYGRLQDDNALYAGLLTPAQSAVYRSPFQAPQLKGVDAQLQQIAGAVAGGAPLQMVQAQGVTLQKWEQLTTAWEKASYQGGLEAANATLAQDQGIANDARNNVIYTAAGGALGLILTLIVSLLLGRSINRRLTLLRRSAILLATEHLPAVVARLRRGENVDVAAEAPPLRVGSDEIGQVGQAIDMVRQTALRSAVEESRLRHGVNDMFRNLARRNQSLLQRQLTMLDQMERRATDPDVLDDLFKMDHLTTRMRRHAEGLIILSGAAPGRGWSSPVKLIDVMRGAVAEVEDFARVIVVTQSKAALTGSAVTDVIHLLAELIENATTLSPPFTQVRVSGEMVANGFAIEIEDRGLGMTPMRMQELNERLSNPPDVNPANTEQLGLFVVGQLARRHGITVTLRPSPYGGTTAVVMISQRLIVDDSTPAIASGPGNGAAAFGSSPGGFGGPSGPSGPVAAGSFRDNAPRAYGAASGNGLNGSNGFNGNNGFGDANGNNGANANWAHGGPPDLDNYPVSSPFGAPGTPGAPGTSGAHTAPGGQGGTGPDGSVISGVPVSPATRPSVRPSFDPFASQLPGAPAPDTQSRPSFPSRGGAGFGGEPSRGGSPFGNGPSRGGGSPSGGYDTAGSGAGASFGSGGSFERGGSPFDSGSPFDDRNSFDSGSRNNGGPGNSGPGNSGSGNNGGPAGAYPGGEAADRGSDGETDYKGLPRRQRQANIAPQLRASSGAAETSAQPASAPNPADVKNTLSAMQRGWQQGRSQSQRDTEER